MKHFTADFLPKDYLILPLRRLRYNAASQTKGFPFYAD